jgi:hypothetical protein
VADFLPDKDELLLAFTDNMRRIITPTPELFSVTASEATEFGRKQGDFAVKLQAARDPITRGKQTVLLKNISKKDIVSYTRRLARQINNSLIVSDSQRSELGLTIRKVEPTPVPIPGFAPKIDILEVDGHEVTIALRDALKIKSKAKPAGTAGANVFSYVGATPPDDVQDWTFQGGVSNPSKVTYTFDASIAPGSKVWFTAFWFNPRNQSGPATSPVSTVIQFGGISKGTLTRAEPTRRAA